MFVVAGALGSDIPQPDSTSTSTASTSTATAFDDLVKDVLDEYEPEGFFSDIEHLPLEDITNAAGGQAEEVVLEMAALRTENRLHHSALSISPKAT